MLAPLATIDIDLSWVNHTNPLYCCSVLDRLRLDYFMETGSRKGIRSAPNSEPIQLPMEVGSV